MADPSYYSNPGNLPIRQCAGGVVLRLENGIPYLAMLHEEPGKQYSLPKGHLKKDEMHEEAARREIEEETGLCGLQLLAELGTRERQNFRRTSWKVTRYFLYLFDEQRGSSIKENAETPIGWFPLPALPPMFWQEQEELIRSNSGLILALAKRGTP